MSPPNLSLILIMACFWLVYLLVTTQFLKPVGSLLDQRESQIRTARETFAQAKEQLGEAIARCERDLAQAAGEGQKVRATLRAEGESVRRARLEAARQQGLLLGGGTGRPLGETALRSPEEEAQDHLGGGEVHPAGEYHLDHLGLQPLQAPRRAHEPQYEHDRREG